MPPVPRFALAAALLLAAAPALRAGTVDEDLLPGGIVDSTIFPSSEVETFRVAAPAGSTLAVDLRPGAKGGFLPSLEATLSDGSDAILVPGKKPGTWKARLPFPADGVLVLTVGSGGGAGNYRLKTKLKTPRAVPFEGTVEEGGPAAVGFRAPPSAVALIKVAAAPGSPLVPRIASVESGEGPADAGSSKPGPRSDTWKKVPLPSLGPWTLTVNGADGTTGPFAGVLRWKVPKGPREDHRDVADPGALLGPYSTWLSGAPGGGLFPAFLTGELAFDGKGSVAETLDTAVLLPDSGSPLGFSLQSLPLPATRGSYWTDGAVAALSLDLGGDAVLERTFSVAAAGNVLHTGVADGAGEPGLLLRRTAVPAKADLAGSWFYVHVEPGTDGGGSVEVGVLTFSSGGGVSGLGARTALALEGGVPTPGAQTPVLRSGSLAVAADGAVTVTTTENLFGPQSSWTASTVLGADILAGGDGDGAFPAGGGTLFLRQGLGLGVADVSGDYLHLGILLGSSASLRSGILAFDGSGGFSGTETLSVLAGGGVPESVATTGEYTVTSQGIATFSIDGGAAGTGIVGPEGSYLFTFALGEGGVGVDLVLDLGEGE